MEGTLRRRRNNEQLSKRLRESRERAGYEQQVIAATLGVKPSAVSNWEGGANRPGLEYIPILCALYNISADELLDTKFKSTWISSSERTLLSDYRAMSKHGREMLQEVARMTLNHEKAFKSDIFALSSESDDNIIPLTQWHTAASAGIGDYLPDDNGCETIYVYATPKTRIADMVIPVSGDSMEPTYANGDRLLIKRTPVLATGEIGVFVVNGDSYVKELGKGQLVSHNPIYPHVKLHHDDSIVCIGRVIGVLENSDMPQGATMGELVI